MPVRHSSRIELSQSALTQNLAFIRKRLGKGPRIASVVKANAYGHGIAQFVPMAERYGIDYFAVASAFEAEEVLQYCSASTDIMIMGILYDEDIPWAVEHEIAFYVFDYDRLPVVLHAAKQVGKKARIHLEVETGCNRTGLPEVDFSKTITYLKRHREHIFFEGLCTHLGGAESLPNRFRIDNQARVFRKYCRELKRKKILPKYRHVVSSAGAMAYPELVFDMVRIGIMQYGFWPSPDIYHLHLQETDKLKDSPLRRLITWKTNIMHIKEVSGDDFIGYGTAFQAYRDMRVAVLPLGYSNGYTRALSNKGFVLVQGRKAPIVGLINMNLFMVDITHIPEAEVGDEVVLIGRQKNNHITISSFTNITNLLNNEMVCRLPAAIPRRVVK